MAETTPKKLTAFRLAPELDQAITAAAADRGTTRSQVMRAALTADVADYLDVDRAGAA